MATTTTPNPAAAAMQAFVAGMLGDAAIYIGFMASVLGMALGAQSGGVLWLVLKDSLTLLGVGIVLGVPAALAATRLLQSQLFGIRSSDPVTVLSAVLIVAGTTMVAGYFPARRATRVDPMVALRYE